jgi:chromosome segregation ATPase
VLIYARSADEARQLARGFLRIIDYVYFVSEKGRVEEELAKAEKAQQQTLKSVADIEAQSTAVNADLQRLGEEIGSDVLADLKTKSRLLSVDIRGTEARIKELEEMGNEAEQDKDLARAQRLYDMRITSAVDLSEYLARREAMEQMVEEAVKNSRSRIELTNRLNELNAQYSQVAAELNASPVPMLRETLARIKPLELRNNEIEIWERRPGNAGRSGPNSNN